MHGLPPGVPFRSKLKFESLFMTENACLRFVNDYALVPQLVSREELKEILSEINREKNLITTKLSTRDQVSVIVDVLKGS